MCQQKKKLGNHELPSINPEGGTILLHIFFIKLHSETTSGIETQ